MISILQRMEVKDILYVNSHIDIEQLTDQLCQ